MNVAIKITTDGLIRALRMRSHVIAETLERDTTRRHGNMVDDQDDLPIRERREIDND